MGLEKKDEAGKIDFGHNLKIYLSFAKKYKWYFLIIIFARILIESVNIATSWFFKYIVDRGTKFSGGIITNSVFIQALIFIAAIYAIFSISKFVSQFFYLHYTNRLETGLIADIKRHFFNYLISLDYEFHTSHKTGSIISKLARIGGAVERFTDVFVFNFAPLIFQIIISFFSLAYFSWVPAVITLATILLFVSFSFVMQRMQEKSNMEANNTEDFEKANMADIFTNIESIRYFGKERAIKRKFFGFSENTKNATLKNWNYSRWTESVQSLILSLGTFAIIYFSVLEFLKGKETLGTLVFVYGVFSSLFGTLYSFFWGIRGFYRSMADFQSLFQYDKFESKVLDKTDAKEAKIRNGDIEFQNVSFSYGSRKIFENFNLKIPKNKKVALVGHSGSGKSTLVKLLYRLYDVEEGKILIDGNDLREFKQESLRNEMSIVPQECILFDDTIYNNIAFSKPDAKREEVIRAMKFAQIDKIIEEFPNKENTIVGERGIKLSGGEKQRVSIARAILANKKILVLDEATSSLDSKTEFDIRQYLDELMKGRTNIIIAHRLSTIMKADIIVVMDKGKIAQIGNHESLINKPGLYQKLWDMQKGGYIK